MVSSKEYDVVVVGGGSAGLTAAISAHNEGARCLILEKAPKAERGGNGRLTGGGYRFWHNGTPDILEIISGFAHTGANTLVIPEYRIDTWRQKIMHVTEGRADPALIEVLMKESNPTIRWIKDQGVKFELSMRFAVHDGDTLRWKGENPVIEAEGSGKGLMQQFYQIADRKGIEVQYETKASKLLLNSDGGICGIRTESVDGLQDLTTKAVILACGGFESNPEWRAKYLGPGWDLVRPRGIKHNRGDGHRMALEVGAMATGHWSGCHAASIDYDQSRVPEDQLIAGVENVRNCYECCIEVNVNGERFLDEGEDFRTFILAKYGPRILTQPQQKAYQIFDGKVTSFLRDGYADGPRVTANSIEELADKLKMPALCKTVAEFNKAVREDIAVDFTIKDGKSTVGIHPPKSNWAQKIDTPPFTAYAIACGISFTFGGIKVNGRAQVLNPEGRRIPGLYAAGDIIGGVWYFNYTGGSGLTLGAVFGRIAGVHAAKEKSADAPRHRAQG